MVCSAIDLMMERGHLPPPALSLSVHINTNALDGGATMPGHMMKIMFAIMDADGDGTLTFEEVMAIHKRIFNAIDANKDGKVTVEELEAFMRE
jgi:Ca2+-binding EF-hand superfamily protein